MEQQQPIKGMPEHAFEPLPEGKEYKPYIPAEQVIPEVTTRSIVIGVILAVIFTAAAAFLGLKIGQVFEAAIPIAIIAVGVSPMFRRKNTILENVIVQSIGAASGLIVAGAIFTLPALFILGLDKKIGIDLLQVFMVSFLGSTLGILFLIPFRKYFVKEMHGHFPFPEATATTQILVAGEKGGQQARVLMISMLVGGVYDFCVHTVGAWSEVFTSRIVAFGQNLYDHAKIVIKINSLSAILGLGYIIGLRYTAIIAAGSMVSWLLLVPLVQYYGKFLSDVTLQFQQAVNFLRFFNFVHFIGFPKFKFIAEMTPEEIFSGGVRYIGIGAIAMAGIMGVLKSYKVIYKAFGMGFKQVFQKKQAHEAVSVQRTQKDLKMGTVLLLLLATVLVIFIFFNFFVLNQGGQVAKLSLIATLTVLVISFLFTSVAARAIATVGTNPVSGMTMMTLILSSLVLVSAGLRGDYGMLCGLLIGGVVCTALSMAGGFITDLKIGYWLGSTPQKQQVFKFIGVLASAASVGLVIFLLNRTYGFDPSSSSSLTAPQANAMAALIQPLMNKSAQIPWLLYGIGALIALTVDMLRIPPLAFALGMYIPIELNLPLVIGGLIAHLIGRSSKDKALASRRSDKGILIASGFIAGGAIIGVISSLLKFTDQQLAKGAAEGPISRFTHLGWAEGSHGEQIALVMFVLISLYLYFAARKVKAEE